MCEKDIQIIKFSNSEEYLEWLDWQSSVVKEKSKRFHQRFGGDIIPVVIMLYTDTGISCWGCDCVTHIFLPPEKLEEILRSSILGEYDL